MPPDTHDTLVAGRYRLEEELGRGGMGVVWRAVDTLIERTVALKELRAPKGDEASFVERALREARNAGRLNHPAIVGVHDVIAPTGDDDVVYIVMEYVPAPSLAEVIDRHGPLPPDRVAAMGLGILDALTAAHALGIVHRDVKPGNVLVPETAGTTGGLGDRVKLTDFGIALAAEDARLTRSGVMGTHAYLAPECFDDGQVGPATDLWALGATLFHAVAGRAPFDRDTTTATLRAILFEDPPAPPCPPPLADVIRGLLTRPVAQRLTGGAARELLQRAAAAPTPVPPPTADPDRSGWQAQPTTHHRAPGPPPHTTVPGGPPPGYVTAQHPQPPGPPGPPSPPRPPMTGPIAAPPPAGPPTRRNNTPLVLGVLAAVAAVVLIAVLATSGGGSDADDDGGAGTVAGGIPGPGGTPAAGGATTIGGDPGAGGADPAVSTEPGMAEGQALLQEFLDLVHAGDADAAVAMLCPIDDNQTYIDTIRDVAGDVDLQIDTSTAELVSSGVVYSVDLTGSVHGESVSYAHSGAAFEDGCIVTFSVRS